MEHRELEELLTPYLLGDATSEQMRQVRAHLDACESCRALAQELELTLDLLRGALAAEEAAAEPRLTVERREAVFRSRTPGWMVWLGDHRRGVGFAAAAATVMALLGTLLQPMSQYAGITDLAKSEAPAPGLDLADEERYIESARAPVATQSERVSRLSMSAKGKDAGIREFGLTRVEAVQDQAPVPVTATAPVARGGEIAAGSSTRYYADEDSDSRRFEPGLPSNLDMPAEVRAREAAPGRAGEGGSWYGTTHEVNGVAPESPAAGWDVAGDRSHALYAYRSTNPGLPDGEEEPAIVEHISAIAPADGLTQVELGIDTPAPAAEPASTVDLYEAELLPQMRAAARDSREEPQKLEELAAGVSVKDDSLLSAASGPDSKGLTVDAPVTAEIVAGKGTRKIAAGESITTDDAARVSVEPAESTTWAMHGRLNESGAPADEAFARRPAQAVDRVVGGSGLSVDGRYAGMPMSGPQANEFDEQAESEDMLSDVVDVWADSSDRSLGQRQEPFGAVTAGQTAAVEYDYDIASREADGVNRLSLGSVVEEGRTLSASADRQPGSASGPVPVLGDVPVMGAMFKPVDAMKRSEVAQQPVFLGYGVNPYRVVARQPMSTFGIDVDTASYTLSRRHIESGMRPPPDAVRTEEFVNFFDYDYRPPTARTFAIYASGAPAPFGEGLLVKIGVKGKRLGRDDQKASVLTFVVDTSGSMDTDDRLGLVKTSLHMLVGELAPRDRVAIVQVDSEARLVLEHTPATQAETLRSAIDGLQCSGSTHLDAGIELGYDVATAGFVGGAVNRVLILSDGAANLGSANPDEILARVAASRKQGIVSSVFGFGLGTYNDAMLETLANRGDGAYHFIDSTNEARRVFVDDLSAALNIIARDVKIQVEFDPARVAQYRQLGYENRQLKTEEFRNDAVDAGEVGSGQSVTALYELILTEETRGRLGTVRVRYRDEQTGTVEEISRELRAEDLVASAAGAGAQFQLAAAAAEFAELLRQSPFAADGSFEAVAATLRPVAMELHLDQRVRELLQLVQRAANLPAH